MRRRTRWAPETGRKAIWHPSWGGYRVSPPDPDGTKSPAACSIPEFCRKRSAHIRTGASSLHSSPGNGGYAWHPPYQWVRSISVTFHRNRRPSQRNRLSEFMLLVFLLFPPAQIQDGQCPGKDKSACPDAKVKKDGCIIPGFDRIRNGRCFRRYFRYSGGFSLRCTVCPASSISL